MWLAVVAVLQGVKNVPVVRRSQMNRFNWKDEFEAGAVPAVFWIVDIQDSVEETWATDTLSYRWPLSIFFVRPKNLTAAETTAGTTVEAGIEVRLASARDAFAYYSGSAFQLAGVNPTRSISDSNPANAVFYELEDSSQAGGFFVNILVGEYQ